MDYYEFIEFIANDPEEVGIILIALLLLIAIWFLIDMIWMSTAFLKCKRMCKSGSVRPPIVVRYLPEKTVRDARRITKIL